MQSRLLSAAAGLAMLGSQAVTAGENLWVYTKGTDTRPEGSWEFKLSDTIRYGKTNSDYTFHDIRPEIEYGITDRLTIAAEVLIFDHDYEVGVFGDIDEDPQLEPYLETQGGPGQRFRKTQLAGYEVALKYNILSPYKDAFGLSVGAGYERREKYRLDGADINQDSWTLTWFAQKNFLDDTLTLALNWKTEFERRKSPGVLEEEIAIDVSGGVSYRFAPKWFVGLEFRHQSDYLNPQEDGEFDPTLQRSNFDLSDFRLGTQHQNGNYAGPTLHYAEQRWWVTVGALFQFDGGGSPHSFNRGGLNVDEHERVHIGLIYGYEF